MIFNILICDDEPIICEKLKNFLHSIDPNYEIDTYYLGENILEIASNYDVIFLDIEMPGINGMETARLLRQRNCNAYIIFLTSHNEFMPEAFAVRAYRFLCKPVDKVKLRAAISDVEAEIQHRKKYLVKSEEKTFVVDSDEIIYLAAYGDGTYIYTTNGIIDSNRSLKYWLSELNENFFQIHKSYVVSFAYIKFLDKMSLHLRCTNEEIPISRRQYKEFKEKFVSYIKNNSRSL